MKISTAGSSASSTEVAELVRTNDALVLRTQELERSLALMGAQLAATTDGLVVADAERRRAEETRQRLAAIVECSDDSIVSKDLSGRVITWNAGAERLYGYPAAEIIGAPFSVLIPPDRTAEVEDCQRRLRQGERLEHFETARRRKDGSIIEVSVSYSPLTDAEGRVIGTSVITRDITRQKRSEEALRASAERLNLVLSAARFGDWSWDAASDVVTFSERAAEIFGIPPGPHLTWKKLQGLLHEGDRDQARLRVEQAVANRTQYDIEYRVNRPDGTQGWVAAQGRAQYSPTGQPIGMLGIVQDITARRSSEEALREEARITETLHHIGLTLAAELDLQKIVQTVTDESTLITGAQFGAFFYNLINERGESYTLYTLSGVPRSAFSSFPMPRNTQIFEPTFRGRGVLRIDDVTKDPRYGKNAPYRGMPKGHLPVTSYLAVPVTSRSGEVLGGLFFGHREAGVFTKRHERLVEGIAAQAAVAIDNARLYQTVLEADRKKDEFLAVLAHELRNPLAPITSALQILKLAGHNGPMAVRAREMAERQVHALTRMVDDLLDVSRIMRGKIELRRERTDLTAVVARAVETARPAIDAMRHTLKVTLEKEPVWVAVDVVRMAQVVANLLNNAAKYTDPGGGIELTVQRSESSAVVRVRDTGIGISAEKLRLVFDMFVQVEPGLRSQGGLGIGLTVVRNLVEMHGGTVEARSEGLGLGSEFIVKLPLVEMAEHGDSSSGSAAPAPTGQESSRRILIVDDNVDAAESLAMLLRLEGHKVQVAHGGAAALRLAEASPPEVAFLDLGMPLMSGHELAGKFREHPALRSVKLIAMTGWGQDEDRRRSKEAGFDHHMTKPVALTALQQVLMRT